MSEMNACQQGFIDCLMDRYGVTNEKVIPQMMYEAAMMKQAASAMELATAMGVSIDQAQQIVAALREKGYPVDTMAVQEMVDLIQQQQ